MLAVGLTGGIGSGKSSVAELLVARGAELIDADRIAREVVEPGRPAYAPLVERFGTAVLTAEGTVDRAALASVVFADREALAALNAITHPAIGAAMDERRAALEGTDAVVVLDVPLLVPVHRDVLHLDVVVVVDCAQETAMARLVAQRGMGAEDVRARMAVQASREERLAGADLVVDNSGSRAELEVEVDRVWTVLAELARRKAARQA